jgi:hypothetical protein
MICYRFLYAIVTTLFKTQKSRERALTACIYKTNEKQAASAYNLLPTACYRLITLFSFSVQKRIRGYPKKDTMRPWAKAD